MEGVRNKVAGLKGRAIAGAHNYEQVPALVERSVLRVKSFFADLNERLGRAFPRICRLSRRAGSVGHDLVPALQRHMLWQYRQLDRLGEVHRDLLDQCGAGHDLSFVRGGMAASDDCDY